MPAYAYTGLNATGKTIKGIESAESVGALKAALKRSGVYLTGVSETSAAASTNGEREMRNATSAARNAVPITAMRAHVRSFWYSSRT